MSASRCEWDSGYEPDIRAGVKENENRVRKC